MAGMVLTGTMTTETLNLMTGMAAAAVALLIGWRAAAIGRFLGLLDYPDPSGGRKRHSTVTPLVGGLAVAVSFQIAAAALLLLQGEDSAVFDWQVAWFALAVGAMCMVGTIDDRLGLSPAVRLSVTMLVLALTVVYAPDFRIEFLRFNGVDRLVILPGWLAAVFTLLCLIGLLNAVNMADGKNGLVITMALIWTAVLFVRNPQPLDPLLFAVGVSLAVLLVFNLKGRLFLGDSGSYCISAVFGLLSIYAYNHGFGSFDAAQVAIMFLIPVLDTVRLMAWRMRHGRSPFAGDRNHLHHYLNARFDWSIGLVIYGGLVAIPNLLAVLQPEYSLVWLCIGGLLYVMTLSMTARPGVFHEGFSA